MNWVILIVLLSKLSLLKMAEHSSPVGEAYTKYYNSSSGCSYIQRTDSEMLVNCSFRGLDRLISHPVSQYAVTLDMSNNRIDKLVVTENLESFSNVVSLKLRNNSLVSAGDFFQRMTLKNLEEIDLSFNRLSNCLGNILNIGIPKIALLNLRGNNIHKVTEEDLKKIRNLKTLDLSANNIAEWTFQSNFDYFSKSSSNLEVFDISGNKISEFLDSAFVFANSLRRLNASYNSLTKLHERTFDTLSNLRVLDLSHNKLDTLPLKVFSKLGSLSYLYLSENALTSLPDAVPILNWFDVSFNNINTIEETLNHMIYPHEVILLGGNPFICDCNILWLKEFYDTREYLLKFIDIRKDKFIPACEYPESLKGDTWDVIGDDLFECDKDNPNRDYPNHIQKDHQHTDDTDVSDIDDKVYTETDESILDFKPSEIGTDSVRLEWIVNSAHMARLTYRAFGNRNKKEVAILPTTVTSFVLKNLDANSPYVICLSLTKESHADDSADNEKCIEVITDEQEYMGNENILAISLMTRLFRKIVFPYQLFVLLAILVAILTCYYVYVKRNGKKKTKQN